MTSISHPVALPEVRAVPKAVTRNSVLDLARNAYGSYLIHYIPVLWL